MIHKGSYLDGVQIRNRLNTLARLVEVDHSEIWGEYKDLLRVANEGLPDGQGITPRECIEFLEKSYAGEFEEARIKYEAENKPEWDTNYWNNKVADFDRSTKWPE